MIQQSKRFTKLLNWARHHRLWVIVGAGIVMIVSAALVTFALLYQKPKAMDLTPVVSKPKPAPVYYSPLTGEKVTSEADRTALVTAIMIENSPDARPQSGLKQSGVIYEAIAEGGITRFLTLHQQDKPQLIGPVRSLRMYYVDWLAPYDASIAHVGGSAAALNEVRSGGYRDIDEFFNASTYWRARDRYAPHNVYTSFAKLDELNASKGYTASNFTSFERADGAPTKTPDASHIAINFSSPTYNTTYDYVADCNCYNRNVGGAPHTDREEGQIQPSVVVAMRVNMNLVQQDGAREDIQTSGSGPVTVFQNGTLIEGTWQKADRKSPLTLTDSSGKPISLVRGQTWIAAVPNNEGGGVSWQ